MSNKRYWIFALSIALGMLSIASVTLANTLYFPFVSKGVTATPTVTQTPTITPTPRAAVVITFIEADPPGPDVESEFVTIRNQTGATVNMTGWRLVDNTRNTFTFPNFSLGAGRTVNVWSKTGTNTAADLFWGRTTPVWDNIKDCAFLYTNNGSLEHEFCYIRTP